MIQCPFTTACWAPKREQTFFAGVAGYRIAHTHLQPVAHSWFGVMVYGRIKPVQPGRVVGIGVILDWATIGEFALFICYNAACAQVDHTGAGVEQIRIVIKFTWQNGNK